MTNNAKEVNMSNDNNKLLILAAQLLKESPEVMECIMDEVVTSGFIVQCERCEAWDYKGEINAYGLCQHCE